MLYSCSHMATVGVKGLRIYSFSSAGVSFLGGLLWVSRPNEAGLYVHPSTVFFRFFNKICFVDWGWWVIHESRRYAIWPDPRSRSRSWRSESCENGRFHSVQYLLRQFACNQNTNGELWYSETNLNFNRTNLWYLSLLSITWPSKLSCYEESTSSPI